MNVTKHQHVRYEGGGGFIAAIVRIAHQDGTATVEARFFLDAAGEPRGPYIGDKFRLPVTKLQPVGGAS